MNKMKFGTVLLVVAALFAAGVYAESNKEIQPRKISQKVVTQIKPVPASVPQRAPLAPSRQGYQLVTDVLDGFGGASESDSFRIPVNSGGQPSAIGISESDTLTIGAGFVHASHLKRGNVNADLVVDLADAIYILNYLFKGGPDPCPKEAGDANCDGLVDLSDAIFLLNYLFKGGPAPSC